MKNRIKTKTNIFDRLAVKLGAIALSAVLLSAVPFHSASAAVPTLGAPGAAYAVRPARG